MKKEEIKEAIEFRDCLTLESEGEGYFEVYENDEMKYSDIHHQERDLEEIIQLNSAKNLIDKEKLIEFLKQLDSRFFMQLRDIIFFINEEEYHKLTIPKNGRRIYDLIAYNGELALTCFMEDTIIINVAESKKVSKEIAKGLKKEIGYSSYTEELNNTLVTNLLHELGHKLRMCPVIDVKTEEELLGVCNSDEEDLVENFALKYFRQNGGYILK